jgi:pilus assembly protein Flp/PilA
MTKLLKGLKRFSGGQEGATMVEYGLLVALISVVAIVAIIAVGQYVNGAFTTVQNEMSTAGIPAIP